MPLQSTLVTRGKGLCLLSLDAGGQRGISQLKIIAELMKRVKPSDVNEDVAPPCAVFDMIGGVGSGGFIAILLVVLGMSAEKALEEFVELSVSILDQHGLGADARTSALKGHIDRLCKKHGIKERSRLLELNNHSRGCKLAVPISYKYHVGATCTLRNFTVRQEQTLDITVQQAMMATLATPPLFTSTPILKDSATFDYVAGDLTLSNPVRVIVAEALEAFGAEGKVACLLSVGCGRPGVSAVPTGSDLASWSDFLRKIATDSEKEAEIVAKQMGHLGLYQRFSITRGLEFSTSDDVTTPEHILAQTSVYLEDVELMQRGAHCAELLDMRDGTASLEQINQFGGERILPPSLPPLTKTFVMRDEPWKFIEETMFGTRGDEGPRGQRMLLVTGMGGCGKTQLILKFVEVHRNKFESCFFLDGSSETRIRADMIRNVRALGIAHSQQSFDDCISFLAQPTGGRIHLIVYDNVDDPALNLVPLMPLGGNCAIIITSRNRSMGEFDRSGHLELDVMSTEEAVTLLLYAPNEPPPNEQTRDDATAVAEELGCLAIALTQARSYMYQTRCSGRQYLERLRSSRRKLLSHPVRHQLDMRYTSAYAAFDASYEKLSLYERRLLWLLSFFHWAKFPLELIIRAATNGFSSCELTLAEYGHEFHAGKSALGDIFLRDSEWDITNLDDMIAVLQNFSLVTLATGVDTMLLQMHPVAHSWARSCIPPEDYIRFQSGAVVLLAVGATWDSTPSTQYLSSHVAQLSPLWDQLHINEAAAFSLVLRASGSFQDALHLQEKVVAFLKGHGNPHRLALSEGLWLLAETYSALGRLSEAEALQVEVLRLSKEVLGDRHLDTIRASNNLALIYQKLGRLSEAGALQVEVLRLSKEVLGDRHPNTLRASNNLASTYQQLGRLSEAEALQVEVLRLRKEVLGDRHSDTLNASSNLALIYQKLGRLSEAGALQVEVLRLSKEVLGDRHPNTLRASNNLASTYQQLGRLSEAEALQVEVLRLSKEVLGDRHPDTLRASKTLALIYQELGRLSEAEALQVEALRLSKEVLGDRHPDTLRASNNLAFTYQQLGRLSEAEALQVEVLRLRKEILGDRHSDTLNASSNLALIYQKLGRLSEAGALQVEVLRLSKEVLGDRHPNTLRASNNLASTYQQLGRLSEAEALQVEVLRLSKEVLGDRHPDTLRASNNLAFTYQQLGRLSEAEALQVEVLRLSKEVLGDRHPDTLNASNNLALIYQELGRLSEAGALQVEVLRLSKEVLGDRHPDTLNASNNLALTYQQLGRLSEAEALQVEVLRPSNAVQGGRHRGTLSEGVGTAHPEYQLRERLLSESPATGSSLHDGLSPGRVDREETMRSDALVQSTGALPNPSLSLQKVSNKRPRQEGDNAGGTTKRRRATRGK